MALHWAADGEHDALGTAEPDIASGGARDSLGEADQTEVWRTDRMAADVEHDKIDGADHNDFREVVGTDWTADGAQVAYAALPVRTSLPEGAETRIAPGR